MRNVHRTTACDRPRIAGLALAGVLCACAAEPAVLDPRPTYPWGAELPVEGPRSELVGLEGTHLRALGRTSPIPDADLCASTATSRARATLSSWLEHFLTGALPDFAATRPRRSEPDGDAPRCIAGRPSLTERTLAHARPVEGAARSPRGCVAALELELEAALRDGATIGPDERAFVTWLFTGSPRPFDALAHWATERAREDAKARGTAGAR